MTPLQELIAVLPAEWTFELRCPESGMRIKLNVGKQIPQERVEKHLGDAIALFPYLTMVRFRERSSRKYITPWRTFREAEERKEVQR